MTDPSSIQRGDATGHCDCGHTADQHEFIGGVRFSPSTIIVDNETGERQLGLPDVWVCSGGRDVPNPTDDTSPWDYVCGCVLHSDPIKAAA